jgi:hypothetical protein
MFYWTKDVVIDPNDAQQNTWYAGVFSGWGGPPNGLGGLYKTTNRGQSWTRISNVDRVTSCTFNPSNANEIYMTSEQDGLWICSNVNAPSPTFSPVMNYPFRQPERVFFNPNNANEIWVTSFGNGMKMGSVTATGVAEFNDASLQVMPNPSDGNFSIQWKGPATDATIYDLTGRTVQRVRISEGSNALTIREAAGVYYLSAGSRVMKLVVQRP